MKNMMLLLLFVAGIVGPISANKIDSKISSVTVYVNGAQVYRKAKAYVKKGTNKIIINDVSPYLNKKSIQASCSAPGLILNIKHNVEYNHPTTVSEPLPERIQLNIRRLEDSLFYAGLRLDMVRNRITNLMEEKRIISNNKTIKGEGRTDSLAIFIMAVDYYHEKLEVIEAKLMGLKIKEHKLKSDKIKTETKLTELRGYSKHKTVKPAVKPEVHQIVLTVHGDYASEVYFDVNYLVNRAGWVPSYDLRAKSVNDPVKLTYKASIFQKTGEDWNNIDLTLSTFKQELSYTMPTLTVWEIMDKIKFDQIQRTLPPSGNKVALDNNASLQYYGNLHSNTMLPTRSETFINAQQLAGISDDDFVLPPSLMSSTDKTLSNIEFKIKNKYTIPADGKETMLVVRNASLASSFNYVSIPKVDAEAFLLANITNWRELNLLPAKTNIYFDNSFVGETEIIPKNMTDTMSLAVGREKGIEITRNKIDDDSKGQLIGKNKVRDITIELVVKNTNRLTTHIAIKDQIPVSKDKRIKVKQIDLAGAEIEDLTGLLSWRLKLKPGQTEIIKFTYQIVHDKEIEVI